MNPFNTRTATHLWQPNSRLYKACPEF